MAVNTNGLQELLSVITNQKAMQMRQQEREQEQANFTVKFEEDKKRRQDNLKRDTDRFNADQNHRAAMEKLAAAQFNLLKQQRLDEIQGKAVETGQIPSGAVNEANSSLPAQFGVPMRIGELGIINPGDPIEAAKRRGEIKFKEEEPFRKMINDFRIEQEAKREAAELEQVKAREAARATEATERRIFQSEQNEASRELRREIASAGAGARAEAAADRKLHQEQLDELRIQAASKLSTSQQKALVEGADMDTLVDEVASLLHTPVSKGSLKGKKIADVEFSEGLGQRFKNTVTRLYDEKIANIVSPELASFRAKLEDIGEKLRKEIYGAAFTSTEEKRAFINRLDGLKHARNKDEAAAIITDLQDRIKRNRQNNYNALTQTQKDRLDPSLTPSKRFVTDPRTGKKVLK